jgi:hypothetical protein
MPNVNLQLQCSVQQTSTTLLAPVLMGISKWHNADFLAVMRVVTATAAAEKTVAAAEEAAVVVVVLAVDLPVELSLHSQGLTCLHICNSTRTINDQKNVRTSDKLTWIHTCTYPHFYIYKYMSHDVIQNTGKLI